MAVVYAARSHVGWRREENEDNLYADGVTLPPDICRRPFSIDGSAAIPAIFAVCDGMGGEADGADAARQAAELLRRHGPSIKAAAPDALTGAVQDYADAVNRALRQGRKAPRGGAPPWLRRWPQQTASTVSIWATPASTVWGRRGSSR